MSDKKDDKTITMTEEQLERIIRTAVRNALRDIKEEEDLPGNQVDEREIAPASFSLLELLSTWILYMVVVFSIFMVIGCISAFINTGFNICVLMIFFFFLMIGIMSFLSIRELEKTKKIEVLSTIFSAIMALSTLLVATVSAYFAYKAL